MEKKAGAEEAVLDHVLGEIDGLPESSIKKIKKHLERHWTKGVIEGQ